MPTPISPTAKTSSVVGKPMFIFKASDKLTDSLNDITDVQVGLNTGDVNKIKGHAGEIQHVTQALTAILTK